MCREGEAFIDTIAPVRRNSEVSISDGDAAGYSPHVQKQIVGELRRTGRLLPEVLRQGIMDRTNESVYRPGVRPRNLKIEGFIARDKVAGCLAMPRSMRTYM